MYDEAANISCSTVFVAFSESFPLNQTVNGESEILSWRLPKNSIPLRYDLWLKTDVGKGNFHISGKVKIHLEIVEATQKITLQYREIEIDKVDLLAVDRKVMKSNLGFLYDEKFEFLIISLPRVVSKNEEIVSDIEYREELRIDNAGFYRGSYERNNEKIWLAATQFEFTDSRHAMPCFDEPAIRAVVNVKIQHDKNYSAISNMPVGSREAVTSTDYVMTKFKDTLPMQTYLLAFVVSDFTFISNNDTQMEQRIYANPQ